MGIKRLEVKNFKSFDHMAVDLRDFNVLVGANASGKSNFIQIMRFLKDIETHGLEDAISLQGGGKFLRNVCLAGSLPLFMKIDHGSYGSLRYSFAPKGTPSFHIEGLSYEFELDFDKDGKDFSIATDILSESISLEEQTKKMPSSAGSKSSGSHVVSSQRVIAYVRKSDRMRVESNLPAGLAKQFNLHLSQREIPPKTLMIQFVGWFLSQITSFSLSVFFYDFDPKVAKKASSMVGRRELEENGENIALILRRLTDDKDQSRKLSNLVRDLLPFIQDWRVEPFSDKSLMLALREKYTKSKYLPAFLLSDGTINLLALIIALYFTEARVVVIEEPDKNVHPMVIPRIVEMLKEASKTKQIIVTTHNPEFVRCVDLEDLLLVSRNKKGFSTVTRPAEKAEVRTFLENEIGIQDLYIQNLLGA